MNYLVPYGKKFYAFGGENISTWFFRIRSILRENDTIKAIEETNFSTQSGNEKKEVFTKPQYRT